MFGQTPVRSSRSFYTWAAAALLVGSAGCSTGPSVTDPANSQAQIGHARFTGAWTTQLPQGRLVLIYASQSGSISSGTITNFGPLIAGLTYPLRGSVEGADVSLYFMYPLGIAEGTVDLPVAWTFHGAFTSVNTVAGTISSETGITAHLVITKDTGPLPLAAGN
jgi:hypothetical protein